MVPGFEQMTHDRSAHIPESASDEHSRHTRPPEAIRRGRAANASQFTYIVPLRISPHSVGNEGHEWRFDLLKDYERSEEHTSELQSLMRISYAVFCLKKKNTLDLHLLFHDF